MSGRVIDGVFKRCLIDVLKGSENSKRVDSFIVASNGTRNCGVPTLVDLSIGTLLSGTFVHLRDVKERLKVAPFSDTQIFYLVSRHQGP